MTTTVSNGKKPVLYRLAVFFIFIFYPIALGFMIYNLTPFGQHLFEIITQIIVYVGLLYVSKILLIIPYEVSIDNGTILIKKKLLFLKCDSTIHTTDFQLKCHNLAKGMRITGETKSTKRILLFNSLQGWDEPSQQKLVELFDEHDIYIKYY